MAVKFINAVILTLDGKNTVYKNGCLVVEGGRIAYCGKDSDFPCEGRVIDAGGDIIMPGLINCHTHLAMSLFRGVAENFELSEWLNKIIFPMEARLTEEDVYYGTYLSITESVRGGVTTLADSYFLNGAAFRAALESKINMVLLGADMDREKDYKKILGESQSDYEKYNGKYKNISYILGCHSVYTCSKKLIEGLADIAAVKKAKTYIHLSETLNEVGECANANGGLSPAQYLHKCGYFDNGGIAAHCVYTDKDDMALLKQNGVSPVHCPASNLKLGSGIAPVYSMLNAGLNVALGTDGSASNNSLDMFKEMYLSSVLQKGVMNKSCAVPAEYALRMAAGNGGKALGINDTGCLKQGFRADIIRVSVKEPHFYPENGDYYSTLVYSAKSSDVIMTMCGGEILYENGNYNIGIDTDKIYSECGKRVKRLRKV